MTMSIGPQYAYDDPFKAAARLHQSNYRLRNLNVDYADYGNRLTDADGRALLNYYDRLGVREAWKKRYGRYSKKRDADLLRSEHIPFNMLAPLIGRPELARMVIKDAFDCEMEGALNVEIEWAPRPSAKYLGDLTSFDTYIQCGGQNGEVIGIGIEVKYTERSYRIGKSEAGRVQDSESTYWVTTRESGCFVENGCSRLANDDIRQIWRNHLLGLAMVKCKDITKFVSVTLYPSGNEHFTHAIAQYQSYLKDSAHSSVRGCTFEKYIDCLRGDEAIDEWKQYLTARYLIEKPAC